MNLHGNYKRDVCNATSGHSCKKLTRTIFKQPWILPIQKITRIVVTCIETYFIQIGSRLFWHWLYWTGALRSSDECIKTLFCKITTYWEVKLYCSITMKWDYNKIYGDISMSGYVK